MTIIPTAEYELEQARIAAGVSITEFDAMPGTRQWIDPERGGRSKCDILVLYRMSQYIPAVANDAAGRKMELDARRRGRP